MRPQRWKMRTVEICRDGGVANGRAMHWLKLSCGHIVTPYWNYKTFYLEGVTKSRCYECVKKLY